MTIKTDIYTIYRSEVTVPYPLFEAHGHTKAYEAHALAASELVATAGQDSYSYVVEWGEAPTREQCEAFVASWTNFLGALTC